MFCINKNISSFLRKNFHLNFFLTLPKHHNRDTRLILFKVWASSASRCSSSQSFWSEVLWLLWVETARNINEQQHQQTDCCGRGWRCGKFHKVISGQSRRSQGSVHMRHDTKWLMRWEYFQPWAPSLIPSRAQEPGLSGSGNLHNSHSSQLVNTSLNETSQLSARRISYHL